MRQLPRILAPAEVDALMAALRTHRDRAMVAAMVLGGLRRCEVLALHMGDLHGRRAVGVHRRGPGRPAPAGPGIQAILRPVAGYLDAERHPAADDRVGPYSQRAG